MALPFQLRPPLLFSLSLSLSLRNKSGKVARDAIIARWSTFISLSLSLSLSLSFSLSFSFRSTSIPSPAWVVVLSTNLIGIWATAFGRVSIEFRSSFVLFCFSRIAHGFGFEWWNGIRSGWSQFYTFCARNDYRVSFFLAVKLDFDSKSSLMENKIPVISLIFSTHPLRDLSLTNSFEK